MLVKNCSCLKSWYQAEKHPATLNAIINIEPLYHEVAAFKVSLSLAMWSHCMLQCKSFTSIFPHVSGVKYVRAISPCFLFFQSNQIPQSWNSTIFSLDLFLLENDLSSFIHFSSCPFSFKFRNSPLKTQHLAAFLTELLNFSKNSGSIHQLEGLFLTPEDFWLLLSKIRSINFYLQNPK